MTNYFKYFGLEECFNIDLPLLRSKYISNSKKYHPDFHTLQSDEDQERVLELSTINNNAWKTLSDPTARMAHILKIHDVMPEDGKAQIPQEFLMEMMDINESLMELEFDESPDNKNAIVRSIASIEEELAKEGQEAMAAWDEDKEPGFLEVVKEYYLKSKYINRIKERLT